MNEAKRRETVFYIFRHGETDWNVEGRMQGSADIPLNANGVRQAEDLRRFFRQHRQSLPERNELVQCLVSSPLARARETLAIALELSPDEKLKVRTDDRLKETHLGDAEGLTREELVERFGESIWESWIGLGLDSWHARFPGGESKGEVRDRGLAVLHDLASEGGPVWIIATHGGWLRRLLHHFLPDETVPIDVINGSVFKFVYEDKRWSVSREPVYAPGP